jgi:YD repeat-containing protein
MKHVFYLGTALALLAGNHANAAETQKYRYDAKGRLLKVERTGTVNNGVTTEYTHDKADNRTRLKTTGSPNSPP